MTMPLQRPQVGRRAPRLTPRVLNLATVLALLGLAASIVLTAPRWARYFRQSLEAATAEPAEPTSADAAAATPRPAPEPSEAQRTISVKLFFESPQRRGLVLEDRSVPFSADLSRQIRTVVEELIKGSQSGLLPPLNPATRVLEVFVTARGVAYVDLSKEVHAERSGGSDAERIAVYSIVNTIVENFPAVRRVQILVEDRPADTLAGHVDLSRPLPPDMTLLASLEAEESPSPSAAPAPSPAPTPAPAQPPGPGGAS
jgi:hypothetical protein